uniref:Uncharacterized protein n=1 Tax=Heterorhabditis bacteriophora TaxID=37862 RepID=A0A1I7WTI8_HETBA
MALDLTIEPHECSKSADNTSSLLKSGRRVKVRAPKHNYRTRKPFIPTPMSDSEQSLSPNKRNYDKYMIKKQRKASEKYARYWF